MQIRKEILTMTFKEAEETIIKLFHNFKIIHLQYSKTIFTSGRTQYELKAIICREDVMRVPVLFDGSTWEEIINKMKTHLVPPVDTNPDEGAPNE